MARLAQIAEKIRSKNAGPFWLTVDIFCGETKAFDKISAALTTEIFAGVFRIPASTVKRFDIPDLNVVKFSIPRPQIQGSPQDRDIHGASWATLIGELDLD